VSTGGRVDESGILERLEERFAHAILAWVGADGYPISVATGFRVARERGVVQLDAVATGGEAPPLDREVSVVFSHIRPQPGVGYDERRWVSYWGRLRPVPSGYEFTPESARGWDEQQMPFFEYSERTVPQARRYFERISAERGRRVKPRLAFGWLFLRATRLPFLTATFVPVALGVAVAARDGVFEWRLALLTLLGAAFVHLGVNVANDVFDTLSGADEANVNPTQFSGGSRVILYGLLSMRQMVAMMAAFYAGAVAIGLYLAVTRGFWPLVGIGAAGVFLSIWYTAPPLRLVHRGLGELCVALGFGPVMVLGAHYVQAQRFSGEALFVSLPVAILIALVLYVNEIPDRPADAAAGKRTLPVRLSREAVLRVYAIAVTAVFALVAGGAVSGLLPRLTLIALATIPLAIKVYRGARDHYDGPYALMPFMGTGVQLHLFTGLLLLVAYGVTIAAGHVMDAPPALLR